MQTFTASCRTCHTKWKELAGCKLIAAKSPLSIDALPRFSYFLFSLEQLYILSCFIDRLLTVLKRESIRGLGQYVERVQKSSIKLRYIMATKKYFHLQGRALRRQYRKIFLGYRSLFFATMKTMLNEHCGQRLTIEEILSSSEMGTSAIKSFVP